MIYYLYHHSYHLLNVYIVLLRVRIALPDLSYLILMATIGGSYCYHPYFTDEDTEAQRVNVIYPGLCRERVAELGVLAPEVCMWLSCHTASQERGT